MVVRKKTAPSVEKFIDKGAGVKASKDVEFKTILIRIPGTILNELDAFLGLNRPWTTRTQWIVQVIHEKLKSDSDAGQL